MIVRMNILNYPELEKALDNARVVVRGKSRELLREAGRLYAKELNDITAAGAFDKTTSIWGKQDKQKLSGSFKLRSVSLNMLQVTSQVPYARIQDVGGRIRPKPPTKALLIPMKGWTINKIHSLWISNRTFTHNDVIYRKMGRKQKQWEKIGFLKDEVYIPGKHYVDYAEMAVTPRIQKLLQDVYKDIL